MKSRMVLYGICMLVLMNMVGCENKEENSFTLMQSVDDITPTQSIENLFSTPEEEIIDSTETAGKQIAVENTETVAENVMKTDYNVFNRMLEGMQRESLFCTDWNTNISYFVNQNKDWYIYCLKDGVAEVAVSLPARELHFFDGVLYFIVEDYEKYTLEGINSGDIYSYTPADGTIELIYEVSRLTTDNKTKMAVKEDGVYFSCIIKDKTNPAISELEEYYLAFGTTEPVEDTNATTSYGFGEYELVYFMNNSGTVNMTLVSKTRGTKDIKELGVGMVGQCCILENELFYKTGWELGILNLDTWTTEIYDYKNFLQQTLELTAEEMSRGLGQISSFTVTEDDFWGISFGGLLRINRQSKEMQYYRIDANNYFINRLYTDGTKLYTLYGSGATLKGTLVEILIEEETGWSDFFQMPTLRVKKLTE